MIVPTFSFPIHTPISHPNTTALSLAKLYPFTRNLIFPTSTTIILIILFPSLPFCRQPKSACQQLLNMHRRSKPESPRIRPRSLEVIPIAFHLPRASTLSVITHTIDPSSPLSIWTSLSSTSSFTLHLLDQLLSFFSNSSTTSFKRIPPLLTWNPSSLATVHNLPSPKLTHILKLSRTHICGLQETQWTSVQFHRVLLSSPFANITHTEAIPDFCSGVATLLPRPFTATSHRIISSGFILAVTASFQGLTCEIINAYLHPRKVSNLGSSKLLTVVLITCASLWAISTISRS